MKPGEMTDEEFYRELDRRAELIALKLALASWRRRIRELEDRIRELEQELPPSSPLRSRGDRA